MKSLRNIALSRTQFTLAAALWLVAVANLPFWHAVWQAVGTPRADNVLFVLSLPVLALVWTYLILSLLVWGRATKAALGALLLISAAASYFTGTYGTLFDAGMITNIAQTHLSEARDLMNWRLWAWILVAGALPAAAIARIPVKNTPWTRELGTKAFGGVAAIACIAIVVLAYYQSYASLLRNHRDLRLMLAPYNIVSATQSYLRQQFVTPTRLQIVGADAGRILPVAISRKPSLTLLVVGETARAANFSLNGYPRLTNPELARERVVSFSEVSACGTATAVSLPCMFLDVGRVNFDSTLAQRRESLLDVLQRAGIQVLWRDNNSGCKGVCDRVPHQDLSALQVPGLCRDGECFDEVLLDGLQTQLDRMNGDTVIVLHMHGSHGPAYFKRYPPAFETFTPVCDNVALDRCSRDSIVNAYDNSLRYTDHVLGRAITLLRDNAARFDSALLYVSDHGESLGENGLYLHGIPYALAPREQIHIPMLLWLSEGRRERESIDVSCLEARQREPLSHDNLYHSILGLSGVKTGVYRPERDLFRRCRA